MSSLHDINVEQVTDDRQFFHEITNNEVDAPRGPRSLRRPVNLMINFVIKCAVELKGGHQEPLLTFAKVSHRCGATARHSQPNGLVLKFAHASISD